jgi:glycosyltransferase involved in cell wall biosynthesis
MTCFNREKYIEESILSVINSNYKNLELIIADDCSIDQSEKLIKKYLQLDNRIKYIKNNTNLGDYPNRNSAAFHATGEYLMFVDSDDILFKDSISKCIAYMMEYPDVKFGISAVKYINHGIRYLNSRNAIEIHFFNYPILMSGPGGTIHRRDFFNQLNGFPIDYGPANDMYHNLKAVLSTPILLFSFEISYYRIHPEQESSNKFRYLYHNYNYLNDAIKNLSFHFTTRQKNWIQNKNRRRLIFNLVNHFIHTFNLKDIILVLYKTKFSFTDLYKGVFHI